MIEAARADIADARKINFRLSIPALRAAWRADGILGARRAIRRRSGPAGSKARSSRAAPDLSLKSLTGRW